MIDLLDCYGLQALRHGRLDWGAGCHRKRKVELLGALLVRPERVHDFGHRVIGRSGQFDQALTFPAESVDLALQPLNPFQARFRGVHRALHFCTDRTTDLVLELLQDRCTKVVSQGGLNLV